jgi:hypothetical protein
MVAFPLRERTKSKHQRRFDPLDQAGGFTRHRCLGRHIEEPSPEDARATMENVNELAPKARGTGAPKVVL